MQVPDNVDAQFFQFQFLFEPGTTSEPLGDPVPAEVKQARYERLMELQQSISLQVNQSYVGKTLDVLVEGRDKGIAIGRSYRDAPEIDGMVFIEGEAKIGEIVPVKITGAMAYDLTGRELNRIDTPAEAIMGTTVGPDGNLWYVDAEKNQVG